jgi:hypothetical protein
MEILALALVIIGMTFFVVGGIWFLLESFRESLWWGLGCLLISPVQLFFLIIHWNVAGKPFGIQILGFVCLLAGTVIKDPVYFSNM